MNDRFREIAERFRENVERFAALVEFKEPMCPKCSRVIYCGVNKLCGDKECGLKSPYESTLKQKPQG